MHVYMHMYMYMLFFMCMYMYMYMYMKWWVVSVCFWHACSAESILTPAEVTAQTPKKRLWRGLFEAGMDQYLLCNYNIYI